MINLKIGCIKIIALADCSSFNIGTAINLQNQSNEQNYFYGKRKPIPTPLKPSPEHPERREDRIEVPEQIGQPVVPPTSPGPISPP
jgi:hypothetical protein